MSSYSLALFPSKLNQTKCPFSFQINPRTRQPFIHSFIHSFHSPIPNKPPLNRHAKILQKSLLEIFNRIEAVKEEHDKLDNNNKFLQKYIGDLMSTSKITATGASGRKK